MPLSKAIKAVSSVVLVTAIAAIDWVEPATALPLHTTQTVQLARRRLNFRVGVRPSHYRVGGYSRSAACEKDQTITALVPPSNTQDRLAKDAIPVDKTTTDHPTFFVHLPAISNKTAQFTLQNETATQDLYKVSFRLTGKAGIVGIAMPPSTPALQTGQKYVWQVAIICDADDRSNDKTISGWVERVNPPAGATGDKIATLAEQGIWQDAITPLALQRYQQPGDRTAAEDWASLMEDAGLPEFKQSEIVQIVKN